MNAGITIINGVRYYIINAEEYDELSSEFAVTQVVLKQPRKPEKRG